MHTFQKASLKDGRLSHSSFMSPVCSIGYPGRMAGAQAVIKDDEVAEKEPASLSASRAVCHLIYATAIWGVLSCIADLTPNKWRGDDLLVFLSSTFPFS